ncbi:hypothetical protein GCM10011608_48760 [Micromonospora sonchi]|uniref:Uncharacterized protein n=1 Tax=Micromonospora sonchi TaxID=1763543 RepID=A0A917U7J0_9ACTN|nr:hypothetical protein GCM10011608_48760 [Micromonospora sonchi]
MTAAAIMRAASAQGLDAQRVRVQTLDRKATERAGIRGVLMRVGQADTAATGAGPADLRMTVDYSSFATAYGADWATRLRLMTLPECALTTPEQQRCAGTPVKSRNNPAARTVSAQLPVAAAGTLVAVAADASGPAGDYSATPLQPSSTWSVGGNTGSFTWSCPMRGSSSGRAATTSKKSLSSGIGAASTVLDPIWLTPRSARSDSFRVSVRRVGTRTGGGY